MMSIMEEASISSKPPQQISEMFQKFALSLKSKTIEFFAEEEGDEPSVDDPFTILLDSAEEFIPDQKVIAFKKPDLSSTQTLISSIFSSISLFESSYLQLQTAHSPLDEEMIKSADKTLIQQLQRLSQLKQFYKNPNFDSSQIGSCLEAEVQENQSTLRALEIAFNRLQSEIDEKGDKVSTLRDQLGKIRNSNTKLSKLLVKSSSVSVEIALTIRVFDSMYREACRSLHNFTKVLIGLMKKAEWDLDLAANSVYSYVKYKKKGHNRYAFLSYVSLCLFRGFDLEDFGLDIETTVSNSGKAKKSFLKQLIEHLACNTMEILSKNSNCEFSKFCEMKYRELINPSMESSIFANFDQKREVLSSWKSLSSFYESYVNMASSIWLLHKLAFAFDPTVEIFQVEKSMDFSMVYMEDVTKKGVLIGESRPNVGFTVIPGFRIGKTIIQSQVYLSDSKCIV